METTEEIYNKAADSWVRTNPQSLSDFTGRPFVFDLCGNVEDAKIIDLGCCEGYCARIMVDRGAEKIEGLDTSEKMVEAARQASGTSEKYNFQVASITQLPFKDESFDLAMGVFVYNYLDVEQTHKSFAEVFRVLKPGGAFVFSVPHPSFPFIRKELEKPFFFDMKNGGYFTCRNKRHLGEIHRRDGKVLPVEMNHKLIEDYMDGLSQAGFDSMPVIRELKVLKEHVEFDEAFFAPLWNTPLHMAFRVEKRPSK